MWYIVEYKDTKSLGVVKSLHVLSLFLGESGIVYRGCINIHGQSELVAIKTGKGI